LLKPEFIHLPTDQIHASLLSFESLLRRIEKGSGIKFDADRDELGWVEEAQELGPKQLRTIVNELTFHNAVGVTQLLTTQSKPPQEIIFYLWSPAPKEPNFRRSRRAPDPQPSTTSEKPEAQVSSHQPSNLSPQSIIEASGNPSVEELSPNLSEPLAPVVPLPFPEQLVRKDITTSSGQAIPTSPALIAFLPTSTGPPAQAVISDPLPQPGEETKPGAAGHGINSQWTPLDVIEDPSSQEIDDHLQFNTSEKAHLDTYGSNYFTPPGANFNLTHLSGLDLANRAKDQGWENNKMSSSSSSPNYQGSQHEDSIDNYQEKTRASGFNSDDPQNEISDDGDYNGEDEGILGSSMSPDDATGPTPSDFDSGLENLLTPSEYPAISGAVELNLGALLGTISPDDIRGEERQPGETDQEYSLRQAEEIQMLGELESQRHVNTTFHLQTSRLANTCAIDFVPS